MKPSLESLARIAEVEFSEIIADSVRLGEKLRLFLPDTSYIDIWLSTILQDRFGFHWERRHLDGSVYRYDNFPDTAWRTVDTYPRHFHNRFA
ncbi:MAG: toxin-antitoxin system TumE family protein [Chloroflexota bacterium]